MGDVDIRHGDYAAVPAADGRGYWIFAERGGRSQVMHPWGHPLPDPEAARAACRWLAERKSWRDGGCLGPPPAQPKEVRP